MAKVTTRTLAVVGLAILGLGACTPNSAPPHAYVDITTNLTVCGGAVPPPGTPPCRTSPDSAPVTVSHDGIVVASGTTGADGTILLAVPSGTLTVSRSEPPAYLLCDTPSVVTQSGTTTRVVQTCTLNAP